MKDLIGLWLFMTLYYNVVRFYELKHLTSVVTFHHYLKYNGWSTVVINITLLLLLIGVIILTIK